MGEAIALTPLQKVWGNEQAGPRSKKPYPLPLEHSSRPLPDALPKYAFMLEMQDGPKESHQAFTLASACMTGFGIRWHQTLASSLRWLRL